MSREVDEERLSDLFGIGFGLPEIEEPFEPVRQVEEVAVFGFEPFDGPQSLSGGRTSRGRAALSCDEVLCRKGRKITRKSFERGRKSSKQDAAASIPATWFLRRTAGIYWLPTAHGAAL